MADSNTKFKAEHGLDVVGSANVSGQLRVEGDLYVGGNLAFQVTVSGDLNPTSNNTYNLGNTSNYWLNVTANTLSVSNNATIQNLLLTSGNVASLVATTNNAPLGSTTRRWDFYANTANLLTATVSGNSALANVTVSNTLTVGSALAANQTAVVSVVDVFTVNTGLKLAISAQGNSTYSSLSLNNDTTSVSGNVAFDTDLIFLDATNNRVGIKNTTPSTAASLTVVGNTEFSSSNTGIRFNTATASVNASLVFVANTTNSRVTFATYDNSNSSVQDGGYIFNIANSTVSGTTLFNFNKYIMQYNTANVVHGGNFGIYDVNGARLGP